VIIFIIYRQSKEHYTNKNWEKLKNGTVGKKEREREREIGSKTTSIRT